MPSASEHLPASAHQMGLGCRHPADRSSPLPYRRDLLVCAACSFRRGLADKEVKREIQALGCSPAEAQRLLELIARETAALMT